MRTITKAIIPAAGEGARLRPVSQVVPKELFPLGKYPAIEWVIAEAVAGGCEDVAVIISPRKRIIREYLLSGSCPVKRFCQITFIEQEVPRGLGAALYLARDFCADEPFAVLLPDNLSAAPEPPLLQMLRYFSARIGALLAVTAQSPEMGSPNHLWTLSGRENLLIAYEGKKSKDSLVREGFGRYLISPMFFELAGKTIGDAEGDEVGDGVVLEEMARVGAMIYAVEISGVCYDIGTPRGYAAAGEVFFRRGTPWTYL